MGYLEVDSYQKIIEIVGKINSIENKFQYDKFIEGISNPNDITTITFVNAHAINLLYKNTQFFQALDESTFVLRDGVGIEILMKSLKFRPGLNMNGTDFIPELISNILNRKSLAIYGTEAPWLQNTVTHFQAKGIHVIDFANGFLEQEEYLKRIDEFSPDVVLLGMGMPKQEVLAEKIKTHCKNSNMIIICGGAIIDFLGGRFPRAPLFIRKAKLEWLFRLSKEPKRLFRRYVVGNVEFLWKVVLIKYFK